MNDYPKHVWRDDIPTKVCLRCGQRWTTRPGPNPVKHVDRWGVEVPQDVRDVCVGAAHNSDLGRT